MSKPTTSSRPSWRQKLTHTTSGRGVPSAFLPS